MKDNDHIDNFMSNISEVNQLIGIHLEIAGKKPGRKDKRVQTLNKSCIVLLTACWETFTEELISSAFDFLIKNCKKHSNIPTTVLVKASKSLKEDNDSSSVWKLAGNGWRSILKEYGGNILKNKIDYFHVPRPEKIDELYENLIGVKKISSQWKWSGMSNIRAKEKLNQYIDLRGSIAHKIKTDKNVWKKDVTEYRRDLLITAVITHNRINTFLETKTGKKAWRDTTFRKIT